MPTYEYECDPDKEGCGHKFEIQQKFDDPLKRKCPECGQYKLHRLLGVPSFIFKGGGWTPKFHGDSTEA